MSRRREPLAERMEKYTSKGPGCWTWTGGISSGYGRIKLGAPSRQTLLAHRVAYEMKYGAIPAGLVIDHRCHNTICVNPEHLRAVTSKQNSEHMAGPSRISKSGHLGVYESFPGRWRGKVKHYGKDNYTPTFGSPEEAAEATRQLRLLLFTHNDVDRNAS